MIKTVNIHPNNTEQAILAAAEREFLTKGFAGARTTSIAEAAGVTHAMLHYYFRTKSKLFDRIMAEKISLLKDTVLDPVVKQNISLEEMIHRIVDRHLDFIAANPDLPRFLINEVYNNPDRFKTFSEHIRRYASLIWTNLQNKIDEAAAAGICRKLDAMMLMLDIVSLNIFSFIALPIVKAALGNLMADPDQFLAIRKKENFETIMRKLKP